MGNEAPIERLENPGNLHSGWREAMREAAAALKAELDSYRKVGRAAGQVLQDNLQQIAGLERDLSAARAEIERLTKELATERADTFDEAASLAIPTYADDTWDVFRGMERVRKQLALKAEQVRALLGEQGK